ncbi:MAG: hypothetical protein ACK2UH_08775 [Candidatus Promineifilaceae bacterium]
MDFLLTLHSINRWIIVVVAVAALIKFLIGWLQNSNYQRVDRILMAAYSGLLDLQLLMGIILLINHRFARRPLEHAITMIIAIALAHASRVWRDKPDRVRYRNNFLAILIGLLLIIAGVAILPQGW